MIKKTLIISLTIGFILIVSTTVGLFELPDGFFYYALGKYLYTGQVTQILPFNLETPQTLFGPIYALLITPLILAPAPIGTVSIVTLQLILTTISAWLIGKISGQLFGRFWKIWASGLFLLLPFQLIYTTVLMSETVATFLVTLYLYLLQKFLTHQERNFASFLVLVASVATLTRFMFLPLFVLSLILWLHRWKKSWHLHIPALTGIVLITLWGLFNYQIYHTFTLSAVKGRHLYNNVITSGKFFPKNSAPEVIDFLKYVPVHATFGPWWDTQIYFTWPVQEGTINEIDVDNKFLAVAFLGISQNPVRYLINVTNIAIAIPTTPPFYQGLNDPDKTDNCRIGWQENLCKPFINIPQIQNLWREFVYLNIAAYPVISGLLFTLALIGCFLSILSPNRQLKFIAALFLGQHIFNSATEWIEGRFILPLYPFYALLILFTLKQIAQFLKYSLKFSKIST